MIATTYKINKNFKRLLAVLACLLVMAVLLPTTAGAAALHKRTYALACVGDGHVTLKSTLTRPANNNFDCSKGGHIVTLQGIGPPDNSTQPYPNTTQLTTVLVDCGKGTAKDPKLGSVLDHFDCTGGKASVKKLDVIPASDNPSQPIFEIDRATGKTTQASQPATSKVDPNKCKLSDGLCASCYKSGHCIDCSKVACDDQAVKCNADRCDLVKNYVNKFINVLSVIMGLVVVLSLIIGGIQYSTSEGDPQKSSKAKSRLTKTVFAFVVYIFLYAILQFLIPGGVFNRT